MNLVPLFLAWLWSKRERAAAAPKPPPWPTPSSPPPVPAFAPQHAAPADASATATPLAELHHEALAPPASKPAAPKPSPARSVTQAATHAASSAAKHAAHKATSKATKAVTSVLLPGSSLFHKKHKAAAPKIDMRTEPVSDLQAILITRGAKLQRDGLYGPKTAQAWSTLAKSKGLPPQISRMSAKVASVATATFDALAVPPIP